MARMSTIWAFDLGKGSIGEVVWIKRKGALSSALIGGAKPPYGSHPFARFRTLFLRLAASVFPRRAGFDLSH